MFLVGIGNEMGLPVAAGRYIAVTFKQLCKIAWIDKSAPVGNFVDTVVGGDEERGCTIYAKAV